jgi:hypothetical protein
VVIAEVLTGVPEITPVEGFSVRPAGKLGVTEKDATGPPTTVGVMFVGIGKPVTYVSGTVP